MSHRAVSSKTSFRWSLQLALMLLAIFAALSLPVFVALFGWSMLKHRKDTGASDAAFLRGVLESVAGKSLEPAPLPAGRREIDFQGGPQEVEMRRATIASHANLEGGTVIDVGPSLLVSIPQSGSARFENALQLPTADTPVIDGHSLYRFTFHAP